MSFLEKIMDQKKLEVEAAQSSIPQKRLEEQALEVKVLKRNFAAAVTAQKVNIIAEVKRASPSKGLIDEHLDAALTAGHYEAGGAAAISVLTDETFFSGALLDLVHARLSSTLPVLRKDFTIDEYQIYEAAAYGADAILLIARILGAKQIRHYLNICDKLNITALVEVYDKTDALKIKNSNARFIGINNRDLDSFETNVNHALEIADLLDPHQIPVIASGIFNSSDLKPYVEKGINTFLVGESAVRAQDKAAFIKDLTNI